MPLSQYHIPFNITGKSQLENIPHDSLARTEKVQKREKSTLFSRQKRVHFSQNHVNSGALHVI